MAIKAFGLGFAKFFGEANWKYGKRKKNGCFMVEERSLAIILTLEMLKKMKRKKRLFLACGGGLNSGMSDESFENFNLDLSFFKYFFL